MPLTGEIQSRYLLIDSLAQNAERQTWLAEDRHTSQRVTLKSLYFGRSTQWQDFKYFEREVETLQKLDYPRIPKHRDAFWLEQPEGHYFCLVQDFIPGLSLSEFVQKGYRFSEERLEAVAKSILDILIYLHSQEPPLIHRDIKPSNLILSEADEVYLIDFGAIQVYSGPEKSMTVAGTFGYMPPEQFGGRAVPASDLYSLGATLIYAISGVKPSELVADGFYLRFQNRVGVSTYLKEWLEHMVEPEVEKRFSSALEALDALKLREFKRYESLLPPEKIDAPERFLVIDYEKDKIGIEIPPSASLDKDNDPDALQRLACWGRVISYLFGGVSVINWGALVLIFTLIPTYPLQWNFLCGIVTGVIALSAYALSNWRLSHWTRLEFDRNQCSVLQGVGGKTRHRWKAPWDANTSLESATDSYDIFPNDSIRIRGRKLCLKSGKDEYIFSTDISKKEEIWLINFFQKKREKFTQESN
ncbi:MAG: serine/threonine protein kinase [Anaerolineae bacterium]|nr:serine/threonine protein kinase [Gloeobacterales cyanobacterium ES-bin-313]